MKKLLRSIKNAAIISWKPVAGAVLVGLVTGLLGTTLWHALDWCTRNFDAHPHLIWLLPLGGIAIAAMYRFCSDVGGTNQVIEAVRGVGNVSRWMVPLIYVSTFITRIFGGSVGSEGAAIQIGGSVAAESAQLLRMDEQQKRILLMSGISGGFASVVGTPLTAIVLAIELTGSGVLLYQAILPCSISSIISYAIAAGLGVSFPKIELPTIPDNAVTVLHVVLLAAAGGLVSILLCRSIDWASAGYARIRPSAAVRAAAGGIVLALLTLASGTTAFNGGGLNLLVKASDGDARYYDFLLKTAFTSLTIGAGYRGGAIVPTIAVGASFGGFFGPLFGTSPAFGTCIGTLSVFCGAINCPMTAFMLGLETFGMGASLHMILACAVGYVCSGYTSLYSAQIIRRSKLDGRIINRSAV